MMRALDELLAALLVSLLAVAAPAVPADRPARVPVVFDADIGTGLDGVLALALAVSSPEVELCGVTTCGEGAEDRAWIACRFLTAAGHASVPVAWGRAPQPPLAIDWQIQYRRHPAVVWGRTSRPAAETAVELLERAIAAHPGELTVVAAGPLTNLARLLQANPAALRSLRQVVIAGTHSEDDLLADPAALRAVLGSGVPLLAAPIEDRKSVPALERARLEELFSARTPLALQVQALYQLAERPVPSLRAALGVALAFQDRFAVLERTALKEEQGGLREARGAEANARVVRRLEEEAFASWFLGRVRAGEPVLPRRTANAVPAVPAGGHPARVHVVEDYETDIERRWWLAGKLETENVPPGSRRACRGVLTQDFDDRMGDARAMYTAVVFNPVPGPPMGARTRLRFRYWIRGTDALRLQIFSLSNGYHRMLLLGGLRQGTWAEAAADMTLARRPDGSGGALSLDERIDDIQFYADPGAELIIDDILLYEAASDTEERAFPRRVIFTGWFDTGKQGNEWPGDFDIVRHEPPRAWKAAASVPSRELGSPWLRIGLRGARPLATRTRLSFAYRLSAARALRVALIDSRTHARWERVLDGLEADTWSQAEVELAVAGGGADGERPSADEIRFVVEPGASLLVDDVLIYEPAP